MVTERNDMTRSEYDANVYLAETQHYHETQCTLLLDDTPDTTRTMRVMHSVAMWLTMTAAAISTALLIL